MLQNGAVKSVQLRWTECYKKRAQYDFKCSSDNSDPSQGLDPTELILLRVYLDPTVDPSEGLDPTVDLSLEDFEIICE